MQTTASASDARSDARRVVTWRDLLLAGGGTLSALIYFVAVPRAIVGGAEPTAVARSLVANGTFADPFIATGATGPTAHLAPLFPLLLAFFFLVLGKAAVFGEIIAVCAAHGIHAALLPRISEVLFGYARPGTIAAVCTISLPVYLVEPVWENMYAATAVVAFCLLARQPGGAGNGAWCGIAAGLLALVNPSLVSIVICWLGYALWTSRPGFRRSLRFSAAFGAACVLVLLPWEIRNYRQLGGVTFVRDNLGMELYAANNDCAQPSLIENLANGCQARMHPIFSASEMADVKRLGELQYNRDRQRRAQAWISLHPQRFRELVVQRMRIFWFPPESVWIDGITWLSLAGLALAFRRRPQTAWFAVAVFAVYPLTYYVVQVSTRFRFPVLWISLLLAGYVLDLAWGRLAVRANLGFKL